MIDLLTPLKCELDLYLIFTILGISDPADPCTGTVTGCTDSEPSGGDPSKFSFKFNKCSTPTVTSISPNSGNTETTVIISGRGLGSASCPSKVTFGDMVGTGVTSSGSSVQCKISPDNSPGIGVLQTLELKVEKLGYAFIDISNPIQSRFCFESSHTKYWPRERFNCRGYHGNHNRLWFPRQCTGHSGDFRGILCGCEKRDIYRTRSRVSTAVRDSAGRCQGQIFPRNFCYSRLYQFV